MALQAVCGGAFSDEEGNPLANGYLDCLLSHDEQNTSGPSQVVAGLRKKIFLDNNGNAVTGSQLFANDAMNPTGSYYEVMAYKNDGTRAWKYPQYVIVTTGVSCFSLSAIIPTNPPAGESNLPEGGLLLQTNGVNNSDQNLLNIQEGTDITITNVAGTTTINASGGLPAGQTGDTIRYNVYGDSAWDATSYAFAGPVWVYYSNGGLQTIGNSQAANLEATNTFAHINPTATDRYGVLVEGLNIASTVVQIGADQGRNSNTTEYGFGGFYRWSLRWGAGNTTNVRYWLGLTQYNSGGSGTESENPLTTSRFATDTPNCTTLAFRFSAGTDTTWKATSQLTGGSQTVVDTTVAIDTNNHVFEICYDNTTARYFIDGVLRASITTNVPNPTTYYYMEQVWTGDNKNTNTAISASMYWMNLSLK